MKNFGILFFQSQPVGLYHGWIDRQLIFIGLCPYSLEGLKRSELLKKQLLKKSESIIEGAISISSFVSFKNA